MFYRLIKPDWGKSTIRGVPNPNMVRYVDGPDIIGDKQFSEDFLDKKNKEGYGVYFFPNFPSTPPSDGKFITDSIVDKFNFVYIDWDSKSNTFDSKESFLKYLKEFKLKPSLTIDSGNGFHAYWRISELNRNQFYEYQLRLIDYFKSDNAVWNASRVMRLPDSLNTKDANNFKQVITINELSSDAEYNLSDLDTLIPKLTHVNQEKLKIQLSKLDGTYEQLINDKVDTNNLPEKFLKLLESDPDIKLLFNNPRAFKGDRSSADAALCNRLFKYEFNKNEALQVLFHTQKARDYQGDRLRYASDLVEKIYSDRPKHVGRTVNDILKSGKKIEPGIKVNGPSTLDCTHKGWKRKQVFGLIGGEGIGKSTVTLSIFKSIAENSNTDDLFMYFSLEMTEDDMLERWVELAGVTSYLGDKLVIIGNEDSEGKPRRIGLQEIYWFVKQTEQVTGKKVSTVAIDHVGALSRVIDVNKQPNFNITNHAEFGFDSKKNVPLDRICEELKNLAKQLDVFLIVQSQTTKDKSGLGDIPIAGNAAYGISHFDWFCDYVVTIWQPLRRVEKDIQLKVTAFQYCKIRSKHKDDKISVYDPRLLFFDISTGDYRPLTESEKDLFDEWIKKANTIRQMEAKKTLNENHYKNVNNVNLEKIQLVIQNFKQTKSQINE